MSALSSFKLINVITKGCTVLYLPLGCIMISITSYFTCKSDLFISLHTLSKYYYYPICTIHSIVFVSKSYLHCLLFRFLTQLETSIGTFWINFVSPPCVSPIKFVVILETPRIWCVVRPCVRRGNKSHKIRFVDSFY